LPYTFSVTMWGYKSDRESRRRNREELFELMLEFREDLMADFVFDEDKQLFRTPDGRPVLSRYFIDTDLIFGEENRVLRGFY
jgi:hypothetical protein